MSAITKRTKINIQSNTIDLIVQMSEGNPGAITVFMELLRVEGPPPGLMLLLQLDDMNIRGTQVWVAHKDWAHGDMDKFVKGIADRDMEMVQTVNLECLCSNFEERAVERGASWEHVA